MTVQFVRSAWIVVCVSTPWPAAPRVAASEKSPGFTPEERASFRQTLEKTSMVDAFRALYPNSHKAYTFYSMRFDMRARGNGWRLDYFCVDRASFDRVSQPQIQSHVLGSDHCPVGMHWDHA